MDNASRTKVSRITLRKAHSLPNSKSPQFSSSYACDSGSQKRSSDSFLRNLAMAAALVLCAVTLRTGAIPELNHTTDIIMTAATDHSLLDDQLGKLSFVSTLFPEAVLVFGEQRTDDLIMPVSGTVLHTWSEREPYISWQTNSQQVKAAADGEVSGVYHGLGEEWLVEAVDHNGLTYIYGNLRGVYVQTGDAISAGDLIGTLISDKEFVFEVFKNGISIDPANFIFR